MQASANNNSRLLVVLTGGTICSSTNEQGERYSNAANVKIIEHFQQGASVFAGRVEFDTLMPTDILSENMTVDTWNTILDFFRTEVDWNAYRGIIVLHGTDTLAYMSSLLAIVLAGAPIPVCMVSSQLPLDYEATNGHANFRASVELIMNGISPNVYAVYQNGDGVMYVHYGAHLLQCANYSDDFFSADAMVVPNSDSACLKGKPFETEGFCLTQMKPLTSCVLHLVPYVGIDYDAYNLDGFQAVVHGTYHSESVCVERKEGKGAYGSKSVLHLIDRCEARGIQVFLAPCSPAAYKYESTGDALKHVAAHICGMTREMAYAKTLVGCALGLEGEALKQFVNQNVNHEVVY